MQVFLPHSNFKQAVSCLDTKRLGNQVYNEGYVLISGKWKNHPAAKIWANHRHALAKYCLAGLDELSIRGKHYQVWYDFFTDILVNTPDTGNPSLVGYEPFHASHRSNLIRKNPAYYNQFGWQEPPTLEYIWQKPA